MIAVGAFLLNMVAVPFERKLTSCYEFTQDGPQMNTMITQVSKQREMPLSLHTKVEKPKSIRKSIENRKYSSAGYVCLQDDRVNNQYYAIREFYTCSCSDLFIVYNFSAVVHLLPDIIFRAPTPIVLISILTIRTLMICSRRTVGTQTITAARRNIPYLLTVSRRSLIFANRI